MMTNASGPGSNLSGDRTRNPAVPVGGSPAPAAVPVWPAGGREQYALAVLQLQRGLEALPLDAGERRRIEADLVVLEEMAFAAPDAARASATLQSLSTTLKDAGIAWRDVLTLVEPIKRIAAQLNIGLAGL